MWDKDTEWNSKFQAMADDLMNDPHLGSELGTRIFRQPQEKVFTEMARRLEKK